MSSDPYLLTSSDIDEDESLPLGSSDLPSYVVIGLSAAECFCNRFSKERSLGKLRAQQLAFDCEAWLPYDAEEIVPAIVIGKNHDLVIATASEFYTGAIKRAVDQDAFVVAICPIILLAWEALKPELPSPYQSNSAVVWMNDDSTDVLLIEAGRLVDWYWTESIPDGIEAILREIDPLRVVLINGGEEISLTENAGVDRRSVAQGEYAQRHAQRIALGKIAAPIDLRRERSADADVAYPYRHALRAATAALVFALVSILAWSWLTTSRYEALAQEAVREQEALFANVFPGQRLPIGIRSRLESEHRRLRGTRGAGGNAIPTLGTITPVVHALLEALPIDARYQVLRIEVIPDEVVSLSGLARDFADAQRVAGALRERGFGVPPVSTSKSASGVSIRLDSLTLEDPSSIAKAKAMVKGKQNEAGERELPE